MTQITEDRLAELDRFKAALVAKLNQPRNVAKGDWRAQPPHWLIARLDGEMRELHTAHMVAVAGARDAHRAYDNWAHVRDECLDVAAFAFFVWDKINATIEEESL